MPYSVLTTCPQDRDAVMKMKIEITIHITEDREVVSIETDQHTDEYQDEKLNYLADQVKEFCESFRCAKRTLQ